MNTAQLRTLLLWLFGITFVVCVGLWMPDEGPRAGAHAAEPTAPAMPHGPAVGNCEHCHTDVHGGTATGACNTCHVPEAWSPSTFGADRHAAAGFALSGKHAEVACTRCHAKVGDGPKLKGLPHECAECHVDRHKNLLGQDCASCHDTVAFAAPAGFDHGRTGFALTGPHQSLACESCHAGDVGKRLDAVVGATCETCHVAPHGEFGKPCADCHRDDDDSFASARGRPFDHAVTGFVLERRHAAQACQSCHPAKAATPVARCESCHVDPHAGQLGLSCGDCHAPDRWRLARFDHDSTGFPLKGRHFTAPCGSCHVSQRWIGLSTECFDCHALDAASAPGNIAAHHQPRATCGDCHNAWSFSSFGP